jgi:hypothetical protein
MLDGENSPAAFVLFFGERSSFLSPNAAYPSLQDGLEQTYQRGTTRLACVGDGSAGEANGKAANARGFITKLGPRPAAPS